MLLKLNVPLKIYVVVLFEKEAVPDEVDPFAGVSLAPFKAVRKVTVVSTGIMLDLLHEPIVIAIIGINA